MDNMETNETTASRIRKAAEMSGLRAEKLQQSEALRAEADQMRQQITAIVVSLPNGLHMVDGKIYQCSGPDLYPVEVMRHD